MIAFYRQMCGLNTGIQVQLLAKKNDIVPASFWESAFSLESLFQFYIPALLLLGLAILFILAENSVYPWPYCIAEWIIMQFFAAYTYCLLRLRFFQDGRLTVHIISAGILFLYGLAEGALIHILSDAMPEKETRCTRRIFSYIVIAVLFVAYFFLALIIWNYLS